MLNQKPQSNFIRKIESELLLTLFDYSVLFLDKKIRATPKKQESVKNLETIVNATKPKIDFEDIKELEKSLLKGFPGSGQKEKILALSKFFHNSQFYSIILTRQKANNESSNNYKILIKYEENQQEERLTVSANKDKKEVYSAEIITKKGISDKIVPYGVAISYEDNYAQQRLTISYKHQLNSYMKQHIEGKEDMSNMVPLKWLNILPESVMGGVLGFTYLGENFMGRRADLTGKTARMVDIHESIHTPDEYETRILTDWIMSKEINKYLRL